FRSGEPPMALYGACGTLAEERRWSHMSSNVNRGGMLVTAALAAFALVAIASAGSASSAISYPRDQTLYTGGTQWGNIVGFNPYVGNYATGTIGLVNETLFRYNPLTDKYIPWLATSGKWTGKNVYVINVRPGVKWSDGTAFTASNVKWNLDLGRF